ncbi:zinc finger protein 860-like [Homarus americanus]|uniref:zinc finger protein 860-like n=1 Tax=Homarus americanus TaxID=6706 RepID=UPI001C45A8EE|nr:zinc finger protein 860-like [Homarus americanus]
MRSADLPVVYDHNNPSPNVQTVSKVIERDEYKIRKKPKGRAKFIGQSKAEKEMALKLIAEIRSQSVMALDTLECKICHPARLFTAPSTLLSHYRSHAGIRPYECRICEAVFTRQHSLNYHMLIHTNQTRFTCEDCDRKFRHPSHFKEHRRRHTGESPYECSDCLMRFKTRNTYKRHLRTRHGKLLTTQGAIIILSQEEADRMKKTQGRKPPRTRQPLKIISPEAAAQMEEEQIWTDFEEGDREEENEDDDEEEEGEEEEERRRRRRRLSYR